MKKNKLSFANLVWFLVLTCSMQAQTFRGGINGSVTDPSGAVVPNADIRIREASTGILRSSTTTSDGQYLFQDLPLGSYSVTVAAKGFPVRAVDNVEITAGKVFTQNISLSLETASQSVEVSAAAVALDTTTTTETTNIHGDDLQSTPLNGRDFTQLTAVTPGFSGYSAGANGSLNGTRISQMNWQIDGTDNNDFWWNIPAVNQGGIQNIPGVILPIDAVEEFSVQTQGGPEAGRNPGGTINLVTKSGGNTVHGTAYYFNRNEALAATSPFAATKPVIRNYNLGASLGGAFIKDRSFYFGAFEKQRFRIGQPVAGTVPSQAFVALANAKLAANNVQPDVVTQNLLAALWPSSIAGLPGKPFNYPNSSPEVGYSYNGLIKLDHKISEKHNLSFRWFSGEGNQIAPVGSNIPAYYESAPLHVQNYGIALNSVLTGRMANQLYIGVNYYSQKFHDAISSFDVSKSGLILGPNINFTGATQIQIIGFDPIGLNPPKGRTDAIGHITDSVSYSVGKHQYRFGGEFRHGVLDEFYHSDGLGTFTFTGSQGLWPTNPNDPNDALVLALADYIAGYPTIEKITIGNPVRTVYVNALSFFGQDTWQVTKRLNLNYGARYDYLGPFHNNKKDLSTFIPSKGGLVFQGAGINSLYPQDKNNFAPRVGFSYRLSDDSNFVIRGGVGLYYDTIQLQAFLNNGQNNGSPNGVEGNPGGPSPVAAVEIDNPVNPTTPPPPIPNGVAIFPAAGSPCLNGNCLPNTYGIFSVSQHFRTPYNINYNLNLERTFGNSVILQVGYVGTQGRKQFEVIDINQSAGVRPYAAQFPSFGNINEIQSVGNSQYNSLQTSFKVRNWHHFNSQFAYTWAHSRDDVPQGGMPQDSFNVRGDYGNSDYDIRHSFTALFNYELPKTAGALSILRNGWQLSSLVSAHTGPPFNVVLGTDLSGTAEGYTRPNLVGNPFAGVSHSLVKSGPYVQWINPAAFALPASGSFGNLRRNAIHGPSLASVDFSVFKNTKITERIGTQLRFEMYNLFNRLNLQPPSSGGFNGPGSGGFGQITSTIGNWWGVPGIGPGEPFNMQVAFKVIF